jgi:hypothetical protein
VELAETGTIHHRLVPFDGLAHGLKLFRRAAPRRAVRATRRRGLTSSRPVLTDRPTDLRAAAFAARLDPFSTPSTIAASSDLPAPMGSTAASISRTSADSKPA